ncbi:MFS transporter [Streptomyces sp. VRA16 Mangrove soil]|uniref:MFS transporter n=1 Tax=Streptomyces sp. VRA16 Mangrove soil TaxID=2817434 RepID=UPI001A9E4E7F|nr:MFS transporter [Streptomyces sp. VRA16 Mangrove soil]MBO1333613.1 MFS transporter [Streptomyces sp. VRA16 Mangrove soil]
MTAPEETADDTVGPHRTAGPAPAREDRERLPGPYLWWLAAILVSLAGNAVFSFALGWSASAYGGGVAGLVLSAVTLPRVLLLLVGGAVSDRAGARRVLITGDAAMLAFSLVLAAVAHRLGTPPWLLIATGVAVGVVDAFYLPASGTMPRRLVDARQLPRALSLRQAGGQLTGMGAGPLGGVLAGLAGLVGAALANAGTFAVTLIVLALVRPREGSGPPPPPRRARLFRDAADGVRVAFSHPVLRPALCLTGCAAGFLLPVPALLIPLSARAHGWDAGTAGLVIGAQGAGMVAVTLLVVRRGPLGRPGLLSAAALVLAGTGVLALALAPGAPVAVAAGLLIGVGNGTFSSHIAPLILAAAPESHLSRVQAVLVLVQSVALLCMNGALGSFAGTAGPTAALTLCAAVLAAIGLAALSSRPLRTDRTGLRKQRYSAS